MQLELDLGIEYGLSLKDMEGDDWLLRLFLQAVEGQ